MKVTLPESGQTWVHYKGGRYRIIDLAISSASGRIDVVYRSIAATETTYTRDLSDFLGFTEEHVKRFRPEENA